MKIVITGGLGFIGQNFADYARRQNPDIELIAVDWFTEAAEEETSLFDQVHIADFADDSSLALMKGADVVMHLAAHTTVQESIQDPLRTFENNVVKTQKVLEFLRLNSLETKFIFASTGGAIIGEYDGAINEEIAAKPLSPYGASKLMVEGLLSAYLGSYGLRSASMRFSNVYGPKSFRKGSVVAAYCKMYFRDGRLQVNGDGKQTRDYIYVDDISAAIWGVIQNDANGVFQLGTGIPTSILEIVDIFEKLDPEKQVEIFHADALPGEVRHNKADISRIRDTVGFDPEFSVGDGIKETVDWFKSRHNQLFEK